ncbi:hypothetical protein [Micromonospora sp. LOL_023]|uniref:hypothetical protein n=1 Tax=Micromonospora sp. LOL_023 TaxID=3345418 RepID=UPI003A8909A2
MQTWEPRCRAPAPGRATTMPEVRGSFIGRLEHPDPVFKRNEYLGKLNMATALYQQGDHAGSGAIALNVLPAVASLKSQRARKRLASLRTDLGRAAPHVPAARDFIDGYDAAKVA